ncbi:MAG: hypothetical protein HRT77_11255 [Halioglobus sp.]|nr:hypothetical protein [Halioglobus sp.]
MSGTSAHELLAAVRTFLREGVLPELDGFMAYHTRVAANALGIVQRELEQGAALAALDAQMAEMLGLDSAASPVTVHVAQGLRDGTVTADERLMHYLRQRSLLAISIDNPKYSGFKQARERWEVQ